MRAKSISKALAPSVVNQMLVAMAHSVSEIPDEGLRTSILTDVNKAIGKRKKDITKVIGDAVLRLEDDDIKRLKKYVEETKALEIMDKLHGYMYPEIFAIMSETAFAVQAESIEGGIVQ